MELIPTQSIYGPRPNPDDDWQERAVCIEHKSLFLADFRHDQIAEKRRNDIKCQSICFGCPVRLHCLWFALDGNDEHYVFGGATVDQRVQIRRMIRRGAA